MDKARSGIFAYIAVFYNRKRRHPTNDSKGPIAFEKITEQAT